LDVNAYCYVKEELPLPYSLMLDDVKKNITAFWA